MTSAHGQSPRGRENRANTDFFLSQSLSPFGNQRPYAYQKLQQKKNIHNCLSGIIIRFDDRTSLCHPKPLEILIAYTFKSRFPIWEGEKNEDTRAKKKRERERNYLRRRWGESVDDWTKAPWLEVKEKPVVHFPASPQRLSPTFPFSRLRRRALSSHPQSFPSANCLIHLSNGPVACSFLKVFYLQLCFLRACIYHSRLLDCVFKGPRSPGQCTLTKTRACVQDTLGELGLVSKRCTNPRNNFLVSRMFA